MNTQQINLLPVVRMKQGCVSNLPEGCTATNIGTWNVRTLKQERKLENLIQDFQTENRYIWC